MAVHTPPALHRAGQALAASMLVVVCVLAGCDTGPPPAPPPAATATVAEPERTPTAGDGLSTGDAPAIYQQVVTALLTQKSAPVVYIGPYVAEGDQLDVTTGEQVPAELIASLTQSDPGRTYEAAEFRSVVGALEKGGAVENEGVFLTLGRVEVMTGGEVRVKASVYRKVGDAAGYTYELARDAGAPGEWVVTGTTQDW
jgi:hypothetical protein